MVSYQVTLWPQAFSHRLQAASNKTTQDERIAAIDIVTDAMAYAGFCRPRTEDNLPLTNRWEIAS